MDLWSTTVVMHNRKEYDSYSTFSDQSTQKHSKRAPQFIRTSDLDRDLGGKIYRKEIENIATKYNTRRSDHVNTEALSLVDPINLEPRLKRKKTSRLNWKLSFGLKTKYFHKYILN